MLMSLQLSAFSDNGPGVRNARSLRATRELMNALARLTPFGMTSFQGKLCWRFHSLASLEISEALLSILETYA